MKKGDIVETIDDAITGTVKSIKGLMVTIEDMNGFEFQFEANELVIITSNKTLDNAIYNADIDSVKKKKKLQSERLCQQLNQKNVIRQI
jgi:hypothetical protein